MTSPNLLPLSALLRDLRAYVGPTVVLPEPRALHHKAMTLGITAQQVNRRWYYDQADVPKIAGELGLQPEASVPAAKPRRAPRNVQASAA